MDFAEVARMRVYEIVKMIKRCGDFDYTVCELERKGLERICIDYNVDYENLTKAERKELWNELLGMAEEVEFVRYYNDDLHWK